MQKRPIPNTTKAVEAYLSRCRKDRLLIISIAVAETRAGLADCELTDDELAHLIALHAVAAGFTMISFDLKARRYTIELPVAWTIPGWPVLGSAGRRPDPAPVTQVSPPLPANPAAST